MLNLPFERVQPGLKAQEQSHHQYLKRDTLLQEDVPAIVVRLWQQMEQAHSHEGIEAKSNL